MKTYDEIIKEFLSTDDLREQLMKPALIDGFVYATNGHTAIKIPISKLGNTYEPNPRYPDILSIFAKREGMFEKPKAFKASAIQSLLKEIPQRNIETECQVCEGTGTIDDDKNEKEEHEVEEDCDQCAGHGTVLLLDTEYDWQNHKVQIGIAYFNPNFIDNLILLCEVNGVESVQQIYGTEFGQSCFMVDEIEVIIMPMRCKELDGSLSDSTFHKLEEETV